MRKKIVHIIQSLDKAGGERLVVDLCNELALSDRFDVYLLSLYNNRFEETFILDISPKVIYMNFNKKAGFDILVFAKLNSFLIKLKPEIIHTHLNTLEYCVLSRLARFKKKSFHTIHTQADKESTSTVVKYLKKFFFALNTIPVTVSSDGRRSYRAYYCLNNDLLIENGRAELKVEDTVDVLNGIFKNYLERFLLIHVGRISQVKNQTLIIKALKLFNLKSEKKANLLIIGRNQDDALFQELKQLTNQDENIAFIGESSDIGNFLSKGDAFCLASQYEGMPISLIEALSVGCIPVCTAVGGIPEMIEDGVSGFLVDNNSVERYSEALASCLYHTDREQIKLNCKSTFRQKFDIKICAAKHIQAYGLSQA